MADRYEILVDMCRDNRESLENDKHSGRPSTEWVKRSKL